MPAKWYEVFALIMRYWFIFLSILIVYRAARWLLTDTRLRHRAMQALPDAGYIGHLLILGGGGRSVQIGDELPIPCEGVLGRAARCDVRIRHNSLFSREAFFWLDADGLHMSPIHTSAFTVDGQPVSAGDEAVLLSGAKLCIGDIAMELHLLKGLDLAGQFEAPAEPYVTPERRRRARRGSASDKKRASSRSKDAPRKEKSDAQKASSPKKNNAQGAPRRRTQQRNDAAPDTAPAKKKTSAPPK